MSVCLSICLCLSVCLSIYLCVCVYIYIYTSFRPSVRPSVHPCISLLSFLYLLPSSIMGMRCAVLCKLVSFLSQESKTSQISCYLIQRHAFLSGFICHQCRRLNALLPSKWSGHWVPLKYPTSELQIWGLATLCNTMILLMIITAEMAA